MRAAVPLGQRLLATGFSYGTDARALQADGLTRLLPRVRDIRRGGSCALDLCHVAEGTADGYLEEGVNLWDYAAGRADRRGGRGGVPGPSRALGRLRARLRTRRRVRGTGRFGGRNRLLRGIAGPR